MRIDYNEYQSYKLFRKLADEKFRKDVENFLNEFNEACKNNYVKFGQQFKTNNAVWEVWEDEDQEDDYGRPIQTGQFKQININKVVGNKSEQLSVAVDFDFNADIFKYTLDGYEFKLVEFTSAQKMLNFVDNKFDAQSFVVVRANNGKDFVAKTKTGDIIKGWDTISTSNHSVTDFVSNSQSGDEE